MRGVLVRAVRIQLASRALFDRYYQEVGFRTQGVATVTVDPTEEQVLAALALAAQVRTFDGHGHTADGHRVELFAGIAVKIFDWLHHHFSHHTEHHLFPQMSSDYYPLVRAILRERYAERFHCLTYREALRRVYRCEPYAVPLSVERAQS